MRQYPREDLYACLKRFHTRALDWCDPVVEDVLVDVCLHKTIKDYQSYLERLSFSSFSQLMEASRRTSETVKKAVESSSLIRFAPKKGPMLAVVKKNK